MCTRLQIGSDVRQSCDSVSHISYGLLLCYYCVLADFDTLLGGEVGGVEFGKLPFGACEEPVR